MVPQIFYQNWIGKKPEFSGKPEEDAESHLLSTRDWMEAHNFPEGEKVRCFRVTLIGEARLWYVSLFLLDNGLPYKISSGGNTLKLVILQNNCFMPGGHLNLMKHRLHRLLCFENESGSSNAELWRNADFRKFQKHPSILTLLNPD